MFIESYSINIKSSRREEFIQITDSINDLIRVANATEGFVKIFVPHTTAAITITQGENPDVVTDIMSMLDDLKSKKDLLNVQGNSDAHLKSAFFGVSPFPPTRTNASNAELPPDPKSNPNEDRVQ